MQVDTSGLEKIASDVTIYNVLNAVFVLAIAYVAANAIAYVLSYLGERMGLRRIPVKMAIPLIKIFIYAGAFYYILISTLSLSVTQFAALAGLIGAGIGFGLRDVFASYVGGIIIAIERPYNVGDAVTLRGRYGEVKNIGLRSTTLVTPTGNTVTTPNNVIVSDLVSSSNAGEVEMLVVIDLFIDPAANFELAMKVLKEAVLTSKYVYVTEDRPVFIFLNDFPFYRRVRAKAYVYDLRHEFDFRSDVTVRAWREFLKHSIGPPRADILNIGSKVWPDVQGSGSGTDTRDNGGGSADEL